MNDKTKSLVRHALTALGFVLGMLGIGKITGALDYVSQNLDTIWSAVSTLVGAVLAVIGFFRNKERFAVLLLLVFCFSSVSVVLHASPPVSLPIYAEHYQFARPDHFSSPSSLRADHFVQCYVLCFDRSGSHFNTSNILPIYSRISYPQLE